MAAELAAKYEKVDDHISDTDFDDDQESNSHVYDSFYRQGRSATILHLTKFSAAGFRHYGSLLCIQFNQSGRAQESVQLCTVRRMCF